MGNPSQRESSPVPLRHRPVSRGQTVSTTRFVAALFGMLPIAESGGKGFDAGAGDGVVVEAGTPARVLSRLNATVPKARLASPVPRRQLQERWVDAVRRSVACID